MQDGRGKRVDVDRLRVGMFIELDLSWTEHPFAFNRFKIRSEQQIETLRGLGIGQVRYLPELSDAEPLPEEELV